MANDWFSDFLRLVKGTKARADAVNSLFDQVEAGMDKMPSEAQMNRETRNYAANTGPANAYACSLSHVSTSYQQAQQIVLFIDPADANTTAACTLNISTISDLSIKYPDGNDPSIGDVQGMCEFRLAGSVWHFMSTSVASVAACAASQAAAATSESNAATSESNAATSEGNASGSASEASTSEGNAGTSESNAASSASAAAASESAVEAIAGVLIATKTPNAASEIIFDDTEITSAYERYKIEIVGLETAAAEAGINVRFYIGGVEQTGSVYIDGINNPSVPGIFIDLLSTGAADNNASAVPLVGDILIMQNDYIGSRNANMSYDLSYSLSTGPTSYTRGAGGITTDSDIDGIRIYRAGAVMTLTGIVKLWGIPN